MPSPPLENPSQLSDLINMERDGLDLFLRNSPTFQEFPMPPPSEAAFFAAAATAPYQYHQSDTAANSTLWTDFHPSSSVNHSAVNLSGNFMGGAGNQVNSDSNNLALMDAAHVSPRYTDNLLESEFARLSLMHHPTAHRPAYAPLYDGSSRASAARNYSFAENGNGLTQQPPQLRDLDIERMRIQSAARGQLGMYMQAFGNLNGVSAYENPAFGNLNRVSAYENPNLSRNLNLNLNSNQSLRNGQYERSSMAAAVEWRRRQRWNLNSMKDLKGKIFSVAMDQQGSRFLQSKLEEGTPEEIEMIFMEVKDHICELMVDQSGNYLVPNFLAACNQDQITKLLLTLISDHHRFMDICIDAHGSRSVQKVLEHLTTAEQRCRIIQVLKHITLPLAKSMNGHHVIQHLLKTYSVHEKTQILNVVADNCMEIATDKSGCCVLQSCVEHAVREPIREPRERLISEITTNSLMLSEHPYGNYVVQYIIALGLPHATAIMSQLTGNFVSLSMSKYGSNVVEKFLKDPGLAQESINIIQELVYSPQFLRLLQDPFGNYVAQTAFAASKGGVRSTMISLIQANNLNLHSHPHGKRVLQCIKGNKIRV